MTNAMNTPLGEDEQEILRLLDSLNIYGNKTRLYADVVREGLKVVARKHVPSVVVSRFPENELLSQAFAGVAL